MLDFYLRDANVSCHVENIKLFVDRFSDRNMLLIDGIDQSIVVKRNISYSVSVGINSFHGGGVKVK